VCIREQEEEQRGEERRGEKRKRRYQNRFLVSGPLSLKSLHKIIRHHDNKTMWG
jgi:hypothetical protein